MKHLSHGETRLEKIVQAINQNIRTSGSVTLRASQTTTTVTNEAIGKNSIVQLTAATGTWSDTSLRASTVTTGSFTILHSSEAATDRVVFWSL